MIDSGRLVSERVALSAVARVTPLTYHSIPGLELQAVVVGLRLVETIIRIHPPRPPTDSFLDRLANRTPMDQLEDLSLNDLRGQQDW